MRTEEFHVVSLRDEFKEQIKQMQEKINVGILLARKRLIEKTKKEGGELVIMRDGKILHVKASEI